MAQSALDPEAIFARAEQKMVKKKISVRLAQAAFLEATADKIIHDTYKTSERAEMDKVFEQTQKKYNYKKSVFTAGHTAYETAFVEVKKHRYLATMRAQGINYHANGTVSINCGSGASL